VRPAHDFGSIKSPNMDMCSGNSNASATADNAAPRIPPGVATAESQHIDVADCPTQAVVAEGRTTCWQRMAEEEASRYIAENFTPPTKKAVSRLLSKRIPSEPETIERQIRNTWNPSNRGKRPRFPCKPNPA